MDADPKADASPESSPESADLLEFAHAMFDHARAGRAEQLAGYVDAGVPVDLTDAAGNTLLMLAAYHGHPATVRVLVDRGADPDRANDRGQTPLAGAVFKGEVATIEVLVTAGADPTLGQPSAVAAAQFFGRQDLLDLLQRNTS